MRDTTFDCLLIGDTAGEWMARTASILRQLGHRQLAASSLAAAAESFGGVDVVMVHCVEGADPLVEIAGLWAERAQVPVILLGDEIDDDLRIAAYEAGVSHVAQANPTPEELIALIKMATEQSRAGSPELVRAICRTMCSLSSLVASARDTSFLDAVVLQVSALFQAPIVSIMLFNDDETNVHATMRIVAQVGLGAGALFNNTAKKGGVAERVAQARMPRIILRNARRSDSFVGVQGRNEITASMCVPIPGGKGSMSRPRGVINVAKTRPSTVFTPRDLDVCVSIAGLIGDALLMIETREMQATMEQRLAAVERLSTIGEIAGGIAHEVANPIACVRANVDSMIEYMKDLGPALAAAEDSYPELREILDDLPAVLCETWEGLSRAEEVVKQMKALVRLNGDSVRDERVPLGTCVDDTIRLLRPRVKVPVELSLTPDVFVRGSSVELSQVVVNLVVNAADACEERRAEEPEFLPKVSVTVAVDGNHAAIHVVDNGPGISPETMKRIFLPLFTTKPQERGTGLGLGIVRRVVEEHHGVVRVHSTPGTGTAFVVLLPLFGGKPPPIVDVIDPAHVV